MPARSTIGPDQYDTLSRAIVSAAVAAPVVKWVDVTVTVHAAPTAPRRSLTVTVPSCAVSAPAVVGVPADSDADGGAEIDSVPGCASSSGSVVVVVVEDVVVDDVVVVVVVPSVVVVVAGASVVVVVVASVVVVVVASVVVVVAWVVVVVVGWHSGGMQTCALPGRAPIAGITRIPAISKGGKRWRNRTATSVGARRSSG